MVYRTKAVIQAQKQVGMEMTALLNHSVAGLIRSGFAIDYQNTQSEAASAEIQGVQVQTDQLTVFTDRAETQSFTLYRQPYQEQGEEADHALLMLQFNDDSPIPLHSPHIVIEAFDLTVPPSPIETGDPDLQPYVQLYLRARPQKKQG